MNKMNMLRVYLAITGICLSGVYATHGSDTNLSAASQNQINWHTFSWHSQDGNYFENIPHKVMKADFHIGGIPEVQTYIFTLSTPFSLLYDYGYEAMVYRNPAFATRLESVQKASTMRDRVLTDLELSIDKQILGEENLRIIPTEEATRNSQIKGELGFGVFHRNRKILLVDNPGTRFACIEELPESIASKVQFVPMKVESGMLVITVSIDGRETEMFFDGTTRPALVVFHNRTFKQLASSQPVPENLLHITMNNEFMEIEGYQPDAFIFFNGLPLARYNVYKSGEKAPSGIRGKISQPFFKDYLMIFDYKNGRFGIVKPEDIDS
ncbi:MAG: hypothetical protein ACOCYD_00945 [bacterium]